MSDNWEMFFRYSIATRDTPVPLLPVIPGVFDLEWCALDDRPLTVWQFFLITLIITGSSSPEVPIHIMPRFLREGADPYCRILITKEGLEGTVTFCFRQGQRLQYEYLAFRLAEFQKIINRCQVSRGRPEINWDTDSEETVSLQEISLREWVAATEWDNLDSLLELLDSSYKENSHK
jgi:hypothetical protein